MKQVTLISLYGEKPNPLAGLLENCIRMIQDSKLRRFFSPYHLNQIHGTVIWMEKLIGYTDHFNANSWASTPSGRKAVMNFNPLVDIVRQQLPITVRFGSFDKEFSAFDSFGKRPYERSFQVQWATNRLTILGWPHKNGDFTSIRLLETLRSKLEAECQIQHKYSHDNDLFMVLGEISGLSALTDPELTEMKVAAKELEAQVRDDLAAQKVEIEIGTQQIFVAQYEKETLPLESTSAYCISDPRVTGRFIERLYDSSTDA